MKRIIALILCIALLLSGCAQIQPDKNSIENSTPTTIIEDEIPEYNTLDNPDLLCYAENAIYSELVDTLDPELFYVEEVSTTFVSKEYLEELEYNSQSNIFFGYSLSDLDAHFEGKRYVFTLDESGQTGVQELIEIKDDTYNKVVKNVAIGSGVIIVCVTVAIITKNPAAAATAGKTVKMIFTASSMGAKAGTTMALKSAGIGGAAATIVECIRTGDVKKALKTGLVAASEGFKFGAIFGTIKGVADGIKIVGNSRFFPSGSEQALKYPEGVEFTKASDGKLYPRFEKYAKATAKFDMPTRDAALNHTGLSGNYHWDAKLANAQCGYTNTPSGYVWHHVEDMQTMILVPQDIHSVAKGGMAHTGGASLIKKMLDLP